MRTQAARERTRRDRRGGGEKAELDKGDTHPTNGTERRRERNCPFAEVTKS
jgi:hypothetical protein